jgi:hypothetical protein
VNVFFFRGIPSAAWVTTVNFAGMAWPCAEFFNSITGIFEISLTASGQDQETGRMTA